MAHPFLALLSLNPGSAEPLYRQLVDQIRRRIASGQMAPEQSLPSVREVAASLAINPMTVSKAYALLEAEGVIQRNRGSAMTVALVDRRLQSAAARLAMLRTTLEQAAEQARQLGLTNEQVLQQFQRILKETR